MNCRTCGNQLVEQAVVCVECGCPPLAGNNFCQSCGAETNPAATVCVKCGMDLKGGSVTRSSSSGGIIASDPPKDPVLMCVLSVLIIGLGQVILGQTAKGITMLFGVCLFTLGTCGYGIFLAPLFWLFAGLDAYFVAKKLKEGKNVGSWEFF